MLFNIVVVLVIPMKKISFSNIFLWFILSGVVLFLTSCSPATPENQGAKTDMDSINLAKKIEPRPIPPIDAAATSHVETASFGLG